METGTADAAWLDRCWRVDTFTVDTVWCATDTADSREHGRLAGETADPSESVDSSGSVDSFDSSPAGVKVRFSIDQRYSV